MPDLTQEQIIDDTDIYTDGVVEMLHHIADDFNASDSGIQGRLWITMNEAFSLGEGEGRKRGRAAGKEEGRKEAQREAVMLAKRLANASAGLSTAGTDRRLKRALKDVSDEIFAFTNPSSEGERPTDPQSPADPQPGGEG